MLWKKNKGDRVAGRASAGEKVVWGLQIQLKMWSSASLCVNVVKDWNWWLKKNVTFFFFKVRGHAGRSPGPKPNLVVDLHMLSLFPALYLIFKNQGKLWNGEGRKRKQMWQMRKRGRDNQPHFCLSIALVMGLYKACTLFEP